MKQKVSYYFNPAVIKQVLGSGFLLLFLLMFRYSPAKYDNQLYLNRLCNKAYCIALAFIYIPNSKYCMLLITVTWRQCVT